MKSQTRVASVIWAALFALVACRGKTWRPPIRVTGAPWIGNTALISAQEKKRYDPVDVRMIQLSTDFDGWRAILEKRADLFAGTVFDMVRAIDQGVDLQIILALDFSSGADGVIGREGIENLAALKGKKVAVERCTTTHFVFLRALEKVGMREDDVILENVATDEALKALDEGRVDAVALWDPFLSRAQKPGRKVLFTSAEIPGEVIDVLGVRKDLLLERQSDIDAVVRGILGEVAAMQSDSKEAIKTIAFVNDLSPDTAERSFQTIHFVNSAENVALFDDKAGVASIWKSYELATKFLRNHDMVRRPIRSTNEVINGGPLGRVAALHP